MGLYFSKALFDRLIFRGAKSSDKRNKLQFVTIDKSLPNLFGIHYDA